MSCKISLKVLLLFSIILLTFKLSFAQSGSQIDSIFQEANIVAHIKITGLSEVSYLDPGTPPTLVAHFEVIQLLRYDTLRLQEMINVGLDSNLISNRIAFSLDTLSNVIYKPALMTPSSCAYTSYNLVKDRQYIIFMKHKLLQYSGFIQMLENSVQIGVAYGSIFYHGNGLKTLEDGILPFNKKMIHELSSKN